jgi:hypothetical protein
MILATPLLHGSAGYEAAALCAEAGPAVVAVAEVIAPSGQPRWARADRQPSR